MNSDLSYSINAICRRRLITNYTVESVAFNVLVVFGLANATNLLAADAGSFYFFNSFMNSESSTAALAGVPLLRITTNSGQGSAGNVDIKVFAGGRVVFQQFECDSMQYIVNTHSAGSFIVWGQVFKVTSI